LQYGRDQGPSVTTTPDDLLYKAVGYRVLGAILALVALVSMIFWMVQGRRAGDGPGAVLFAAAFSSAALFVKSGKYFGAWNAIRRGMIRRASIPRQ
jgi:hypothetical protein